uniref:Myb/SANT-like DNA-binding domain-containing protein n=3 Tax=Seriola dumerili TaxID=41447 RepID=A0A3B4T230_SERDU
MANTYRMTDRDIRLMIHLRATNAAIFTGRRNSAMRGWRAIRKEMGLQGMMSARQLKKKWDNLKEKYRVLKNPPEGMENLTRPSSWRWFHLMDEAMSGRLTGTASVVQPSLLDEDEEHTSDLLPLSPPSTREAFSFSGLSVVERGTVEEVGALGGVLEISGIKAENRAESPAAAAGGDREGLRSPDVQPVMGQSQTALLYATLQPDTGNTPCSSRDLVREAAEVDRKLCELQREREALEREQAEFDRELIALERDRELLNRDMAALERDRTAVDRERAAVERERAFLDRDRAFLDRDRAFLDRDRAFLERATEDLERDRALFRREREGEAVDRHHVEMMTEKEVVLQTRFYQSLMASDLDPDQLETRQRLVSLFQKLVEKL